MKTIYYKGCYITQLYGYVQIRFPDGTGCNVDTVQEAKHEIDQYEEWIDNRGISIEEFEDAMNVLQGRSEE